MRNLLVLVVFLTPIGIHSYPIGTEQTRFHRSIVTQTRRSAALRINLRRHALLLPDGDEPPSKININPIYLSLATLETIYWYYLAPGIDPASRWFAPPDGELISKLLDPTINIHSTRLRLLVATSQLFPDIADGLGIAAAARGERQSSDFTTSILSSRIFRWRRGPDPIHDFPANFIESRPGAKPIWRFPETIRT